MEFGDKLKNLRAEKGVSQKQLADIIFVSRSAIAKWENGLGLPSEESFHALVHYFGVSKEFFETEEPEAVILQKKQEAQKMLHFYTSSGYGSDPAFIGLSGVSPGTFLCFSKLQYDRGLSNKARRK